jgi:hypothetical protein
MPASSKPTLGNHRQMRSVGGSASEANLAGTIADLVATCSDWNDGSRLVLPLPSQGTLTSRRHGQPMVRVRPVLPSSDTKYLSDGFAVYKETAFMAPTLAKEYQMSTLIADAEASQELAHPPARRNRAAVAAFGLSPFSLSVGVDSGRP